MDTQRESTVSAPDESSAKAYALSMETRLRRPRLLEGIDLQHGLGLEIGPLYAPLVSKDESAVYYVDHLDTEGLLAKYDSDPNVDTSLIVPVDFVSSGDLRECIPPNTSFNYVVASHVIEHVPDLIGWLDQVESILANDGSLCLVIPDRRFTFDYMRRETELFQVVASYGARATRPTGPALADYVLNCAPVDAASAWQSGVVPANLERTHSVDQAISIVNDAEVNGNYHDVHVWVFTPKSFAALMAELVGCGLARYRCDHFVDTAENEIEFYVRLVPCNDAELAVKSWKAMAASTHDGRLSSTTTLRRKLRPYKQRAVKRVRRAKKRLRSS